MATIIISAVLILFVALAVRRVVRVKKAGGCCGGCSGCHASCPSKRPDDIRK